jgi:hypothetical protein
MNVQPGALAVHEHLQLVGTHLDVRDPAHGARGGSGRVEREGQHRGRRPYADLSPGWVKAE